ncbi:MAG: UDP-glucose 4-epimerase GalE [Clostridia bacterium]|nr:UDP-glucose 4-epimerase GalE [Clostridia bacterium]
MSILVTGGAGYIGSHTCVELLNAGYEIVIADNMDNAKPQALDAIRTITGKDFAFYRIDLRDRAAMEDMFEKENIDAVIHFAGLKAVGESVAKPLMYYNNNLYGFIVLAETMEKYGVGKLVFSSSATVYGMNNPVPFREEMPTSATNPYGYTKVMIEQMLNDICVAHPEWAVCKLRYFNPIGAHESGLIGEDPNGIPNNLMPYVARVAAGKLKELSVFGNDYDTPDGTGVRDYIHVVDLAKGHLAALAYIENNAGCEAVNLGTGNGTSVLELVHAFEKASGRKVAYRIVDRRPGDIATCYADPEKAATLL